MNVFVKRFEKKVPYKGHIWTCSWRRNSPRKQQRAKWRRTRWIRLLRCLAISQGQGCLKISLMNCGLLSACKKNVHVSFMIRNVSCVPFIYLHVSISSEWSHTCFNFIYLLESGQFFWRVPSLNQAAMISNRPTRTWRTVLPPDIPPPPAENVCICKCYLICSLLI